VVVVVVVVTDKVKLQLSLYGIKDEDLKRRMEKWRYSSMHS
jgi:hypothetical protein